MRITDLRGFARPIHPETKLSESGVYQCLAFYCVAIRSWADCRSDQQDRQGPGKNVFKI